MGPTARRWRAALRFVMCIALVPLLPTMLYVQLRAALPRR